MLPSKSASHLHTWLSSLGRCSLLMCVLARVKVTVHCHAKACYPTELDPLAENKISEVFPLTMASTQPGCSLLNGHRCTTSTDRAKAN